MKKIIVLAVMFAFAAPAFANDKVGPQTDLKDCNLIKQQIDKAKQAANADEQNGRRDTSKSAQ